MDPNQVSAQFAAYVWYSSQQPNDPRSAGKAIRYAKRHWAEFLPCADRGIGRLLIRVAEVDRRHPLQARTPHGGTKSRGRPVAAGE